MDIRKVKNLSPEDSIYYQRISHYNAYQISRHNLSRRGSVFLKISERLMIENEPNGKLTPTIESFEIILN